MIRSRWFGVRFLASGGDPLPRGRHELIGRPLPAVGERPEQEPVEMRVARGAGIASVLSI